MKKHKFLNAKNAVFCKITLKVFCLIFQSNPYFRIFEDF